MSFLCVLYTEEGCFNPWTPCFCLSLFTKILTKITNVLLFLGSMHFISFHVPCLSNTWRMQQSVFLMSCVPEFFLFVCLIITIQCPFRWSFGCMCLCRWFTDLQCCVSFRYTAKSFNFIYIYIYIYIHTCIYIALYIYIVFYINSFSDSFPF